MTTDATREPCIDAETLAAWADAGLSAAEAARVELHLSNCERCQEVLAAFVRSQPVAAVVIPFWTRPSVRLGAAGLAVAASLVLIIWTSRPPVPGVPGDEDSRVAVNEAAPSAPPVAPPQPIPTPVPEPGAPAAPKSVPARRPNQAKPAPAPPAPLPTAAASLPAPAPPAPLGPPPIAPPVSAPPPPQPQQRPLDATKLASRAGIPAMAESVSDASVRIIEIVAPDLVANAAPTARRGGAGGGRGGAPLTPTRWRIVGGTRVDRSADGGVTWMPLVVEPPLEPPVTTGLTAGVAASQTVCWIVGREGVVLVTTGGGTLRRVSSPTTDDLVRVTAVDGQRATVTVTGGRTFSTVDGGLTWTPGRSLQGF